MGLQTMVDRIKLGQLAIPDPPCLRCTWKKYCTDNKVGCDNFKSYVNEGQRSSTYTQSGGMVGENKPWPKHGPKPILVVGKDGI